MKLQLGINFHQDTKNNIQISMLTGIKSDNY